MPRIAVNSFPLILNLLKDVIPSVAEESEMPALESLSDFRFLGYARNDTVG